MYTYAARKSIVERNITGIHLHLCANMCARSVCAMSFVSWCMVCEQAWRAFHRKQILWYGKLCDYAHLCILWRKWGFTLVLIVFTYDYCWTCLGFGIAIHWDSFGRRGMGMASCEWNEIHTHTQQKKSVISCNEKRKKPPKSAPFMAK